MYSKQYLDKPETFWNQVKWTDEVKMKLIGNNHQRYVWRKKKKQGKVCDKSFKKKKRESAQTGYRKHLQAVISNVLTTTPPRTL